MIRATPREAVLVVNAHSRRGQALFEEAKIKLEEAGIRLIAAHPVTNPRKLNSVVQKAVRDGAPMVIVGGGDGTLSSTVDDLVGHNCVFAVLPLGTANSFARTLGLPLDLDGAVDTIANGKLRRIDLGRINGDYFANAAALGLSPMIGESVPHKLKRYLGRVGYLIWAIWCFLKFRPFRVNIDDGTGPKRMWTTEVRIFNGRFHGGVELTETTDVDSGDIVIQVVTGRQLFRLVFDWYAKFFNLTSRDANTVEFRSRRLILKTWPRHRISIDGEINAHTPAIVEVASCAIDVAVPA